MYFLDLSLHTGYTNIAFMSTCGGQMNRLSAINVLKELDKRGKYVFTKHDLSKFFLEDSPKTFTEGLNRLVKSGILIRAARGVYVNKDAKSFDRYTIERIVIALRRGEYSYTSLESMLSEYGLISQIPIDRLTVVTTGRRGIYKTPFGTVEFTHTKRPVKNIINNTSVIEGRPLRVATKTTALRDLKRVGRNTEMVKGSDDDRFS